MSNFQCFADPTFLNNDLIWSGSQNFFSDLILIWSGVSIFNLIWSDLICWAGSDQIKAKHCKFRKTILKFILIRNPIRIYVVVYNIQPAPCIWYLLTAYAIWLEQDLNKKNVNCENTNFCLCKKSINYFKYTCTYIYIIYLYTYMHIHQGCSGIPIPIPKIPRFWPFRIPNSEKWVGMGRNMH
jgi:hypothetical protein